MKLQHTGILALLAGYQAAELSTSCKDDTGDLEIIIPYGVADSKLLFLQAGQTDADGCTYSAWFGVYVQFSKNEDCFSIFL